MPRCPSPRSAPSIAERAGVKVVDGGTVRRSIERRVLGLIGRKTAIEESPPLTEAEIAELNGRHARAMRYLVIGHGRAGGRRHRHRRVHGAAHVVCHGGQCSAPAGKK